MFPIGEIFDIGGKMSQLNMDLFASYYLQGVIEDVSDRDE